MYRLRYLRIKSQEIGADMTVGSIPRLLIQFASPLLLANLVQQLYNSVDMIIVGKVVGNAGTVGVSTGGEVASLLTFIATSFGMAGQVYAAQLMGGRRRDAIGEMFQTILSFMLLVSLVCMAACIIFCTPLLRVLNCPEEAFEQARSYMLIVSFGLPFVFGYNAVSGIMRGIGESKKPLLFITVSAISNVAMDLLLVVLVPMKAAGSAIATVIAQIMAFTTAMVYLRYWVRDAVFRVSPGNLRIQRKYLMPLLRIGIPLTVQSTCIHFSQLICVSWVNSFGIVAASTNSIGNKLGRFINVLTNGINGAGGSIVGQNLGAGKHDRVKRTVYCALAISLVLCGAEFALVLFCPRQMMRLFTNDPEVVEMGIIYLHILMITFILTALQGPYTSVITGCGNAKLNFCCGILDGIVLRLGVSYVLAFTLKMGAAGYWYGNALAHLGPVLIGIAYFYSGKWKTYQFLRDEK